MPATRPADFGDSTTESTHHAALVLQGLWIIVLTLPRTYDSTTQRYSNLYGNLLDYIIFGVLVFYILTMAAIFVLRRTRADTERPVRAWGYPWLTAIYIVCAVGVCLALLVSEKTRANAGGPVYFSWRAAVTSRS